MIEAGRRGLRPNGVRQCEHGQRQRQHDGTALAGQGAPWRDGVVGQIINIGSNFEISIGDTAKTIADLMGVDIAIETDEQRLRPENSEVERLWASNDKACELLKWRPEYDGRDGFRRGLVKTIEWFRDPVQMARYKAGIYNI